MCWLSYFRAYKTIVEDDLKFPLIYGEGKKVRNMENLMYFTDSLQQLIHYWAVIFSNLLNS